MDMKKKVVAPVKKVETSINVAPARKAYFGSVTKPTREFTQALAAEIVKSLTALGQISRRPFEHKVVDSTKESVGEHPMLVDSSVLIDGRILQVVNSGFIAGTLVIPQFILREVQHIADDSDPMRRAKGRRGLDMINALKSQKVKNQRQKIPMT